MGLDMSLSKKTYVQNWDHYKAPQVFQITVKKGGKTFKGINPKRITYIIEEVARWRKANQIHAWFVDNVQEGQDDCGTYYVSTTQLGELLKLCETVAMSSRLVPGKIKNGERMNSETKEWEPILEDGKLIEDASVAHALLPTQKGFFFGGTDYDEYYLADVIYTRDTLKALLAEEPTGDYEYSSSW